MSMIFFDEYVRTNRTEPVIRAGIADDAGTDDDDDEIDDNG